MQSKKAIERAAEKAALLAIRDALREKYPADIYSRLEREPDDLLAFSRRLIRYGSRYNVPPKEYDEMGFEPSLAERIETVHRRRMVG